MSLSFARRDQAHAEPDLSVTPELRVTTSGDPGGLLGAGAPAGPPLERGAAGDRERVNDAARQLALAAPPEGLGLARKWALLAGLGRYDLVVGRLAEGHVDATGILAEAGHPAEPGAFYGVWASASGGTGLRAAECSARSATGGPAPGWHLTGRLRFCTGARALDRALVVARTGSGELLLLDVDLRTDGWRPVEGTWPAVGMDLSDSLDVEADVVVPASAQVGPAGFYLSRPGFALGGIGVAAVWLGGAAGVLDTIAAGLTRFEPDPHQLAELGTMGAAVLAAADVLTRAAATAPELAPEELPALALRARSTVEQAARVVLDLAPRLTGPTPLCRDAAFAHRLADLMVYVRQHHAERDLAALGRTILDDGPFG